ncbi:hypothetical protein K491DRAFT_220245 [Lophiostoma macrostomum CBS 122681]|uniref:Uncharacterized protein n=1 Tax=Lophiostoma macrostomum CBS 122681 TaxID=1314788 RepID=A0A6A6SPV3_9PLEO|nr:hypothetical protein K491DRAFT_220245 [Lophiostoma macrostomum CBS 122681]
MQPEHPRQGSQHAHATLQSHISTHAQNLQSGVDPSPPPPTQQPQNPFHPPNHTPFQPQPPTSNAGQRALTQSTHPTTSTTLRPNSNSSATLNNAMTHSSPAQRYIHSGSVPQSHSQDSYRRYAEEAELSADEDMEEGLEVGDEFD